MGITNSNKEALVSSITCGDTFQVRLSLAAAPNITENPTDIVLILDRSGSMSGKPLTNLKIGANKFIDIIDEATDSAQDGVIGGGSHIGIVSFSDTAVADTPLTTSVADLKQAVDSLSAGGSTNHADAFTKALALFNPLSTNAKVMVMFTDGNTTAGGDPNTVATLAKSQGVSIYCIGLVGSDGLNVAALNSWASDPDSAYVAITPDDAELEDLFEELAKNIVIPGATDIVIDERVNPCFKIVSISAPTVGTATVVGTTALRWTIDALGVTSSEGAELIFTLQHVGVCTGTVTVNESIDYTDKEGNYVAFPNPTVEIDCGVVIIPEECPVPSSLVVEGCEDAVEFDAGDLEMESLGRIVQVDATVRNVCPGKRVALAIILTEVDNKGIEHKRGLKTVVLPAHNSAVCRDVTVRCVKFVLPEELDVSGCPNGICNQRKFNVRTIAHYIDNDFECCNLVD